MAKLTFYTAFVNNINNIIPNLSKETQIFNRSAVALPGLSSGRVFELLINTKKNINNPVVT
jgi:hypothetical protein